MNCNLITSLRFFFDFQSEAWNPGFLKRRISEDLLFDKLDLDSKLAAAMEIKLGFKDAEKTEGKKVFSFV